MQYHEHIGYKSNSNIRAAIESIGYYPFHLHKKDIEIICVLNGAVDISDSATRHTLNYGDVYIFNANDPHKIEGKDRDNIILTVQVDKIYYEQLLKELRDAYFICDTFSQENYSMEIKHLRFLLAKIYKQYLEGVSDYVLENTGKELLSLLLDEFQNYVYKEDETGKKIIVRLKNSSHIYRNYERMYKIVDYVIEHFRENITLKKIASIEYLSEAHLSRYIKDTLGLTYSQLLSLTRCEEAERLLASTNKTVDQIAEAVGFSNRKHLATQFKKWFLKTPTQYRKEILNDLLNDKKINLKTFDYDYALRLINMYLDES